MVCSVHTSLTWRWPQPPLPPTGDESLQYNNRPDLIPTEQRPMPGGWVSSIPPNATHAEIFPRLNMRRPVGQDRMTLQKNVASHPYPGPAIA